MNFRLSAVARPVNYDLFFDVDLAGFEFHGKECVEIDIVKKTSKLILHSSGLKIKNASLVANGVAIKPVVRMDGKSEMLVLKLSRPVKGSAKLFIEFSGKLNDNLLGFYRSRYMDGKEEKYLATTLFEAPHARKAFPCFDEPEYKATFDVTLKIRKNLQAISNMPVKEETIIGDKKLVRFHKTPKMSTYLLYLGIGEFEFLEDMLGGISLRVFTLPGKKEQGRFALDMAKKFLSYFQDYSGIPYPLPKLDLIALPDFGSSAMENWGAMTFREVALFVDSKTSTAVKKRIAMVISHEIWHQWSGNLVTMKWWNDLWLNESFATYIAYKAVDYYFPEWKMWEDFIRGEVERAFDDDSLKTTHPIEVEVKDVHQIEEIFDAISYSKGGSVLRMIESYLGEEAFRKGVNKYLKDNAYGNAVSEDFWNALSAVSNKPIREIALSWIKKAGYPLVEASHTGNNLVLRQGLFFNEGSKEQWMIPLIIKTDRSVITELMDGHEKKISVDGKWFKLNYGQAGFYRVKYSDEDMKKLKALVYSKQLPAADRWGAQNDMFELCLNGKVGLEQYLDFTEAYSNEDNYLVLGSLYSSIRAIHFIFSQEDFWPRIWGNFRSRRKPFSRILEKLGWEPMTGESPTDALLRELAIRYMGFVEDEAVVKKAAEYFEKYAKNKIKLNPDIRSPVFNIVAANGNEKTYNEFMNLYNKTQSPEEKRAILIALGNFKDKRLLERVLGFAISGKVRTQDTFFIFGSVASNPLSRTFLFDFSRKNWKKLKSYEKSGRIFMYMVESMITAYVDKEMQRDLKKFFSSHPVKYKMALDRSFERLGRNITFKEKNKAVLSDYFKDKNK